MIEHALINCVTIYNDNCKCTINIEKGRVATVAMTVCPSKVQALFGGMKWVEHRYILPHTGFLG